mmetsp:Transcript_38218/g.75226  ORF Transcript_38218/g.75226 Transcript_38218/m.75226 type:complete len:236 (+) Transcript_38218:644-1351(+)
MCTRCRAIVLWSTVHPTTPTRNAVQRIVGQIDFVHDCVSRWVGQQHRGTFRSPTILVCISRQRGDARNGKEVRVVLLQKVNDETTQTAVHMKTNAIVKSQLAEVFDRVHNSTWVRRARTNNANDALAVLVEGFFKGFHPDGAILIRRNAYNLKVISNACFHNSSMNGVSTDHHAFSRFMTAVSDPPIFVASHGCHQTFRSTTGAETHNLANCAAKYTGYHIDDLVGKVITNPEFV